MGVGVVDGKPFVVGAGLGRRGGVMGWDGGGKEGGGDGMGLGR